MAKVRSKTWTFLILTLCALPLIALVVYFLYFDSTDYSQVERPDQERWSAPVRGPAPRIAVLNLSASLRLESTRIGPHYLREHAQTVAAEALIRNQDAVACRLVYTPWPSSLFEVRIYFRGRHEELNERLESPVVPHPSPAEPVPAGAPVAPPLRHFVAELKPGQTLSLPLPLQPPFDLHRPGHYRLEAFYKPKVFAAEQKLNAEAQGLYLVALPCTPLDFEILESELPPTPEAPAAPAHVPRP